MTNFACTNPARQKGKFTALASLPWLNVERCVMSTVQTADSTSLGIYPVKRCYEVDFRIFYKIPGGVRMSTEDAKTKLTRLYNTVQMLLLTTSKCRGVQIAMERFLLTSPGVDNVLLGATVVFTTTEIVSLQNVDKTLTGCIERVRGYASMIGLASPSLTANKTTYTRYNSTMDKERSCCGSTPPPCCTVGSVRSIPADKCGKGFLISFVCVVTMVITCFTVAVFKGGGGSTLRIFGCDQGRLERRKSCKREKVINLADGQESSSGVCFFFFVLSSLLAAKRDKSSGNDISQSMFLVSRHIGLTVCFFLDVFLKGSTASYFFTLISLITRNLQTYRYFPRCDG